MKRTDHSRVDLTSDSTVCSRQPDQKQESDIEFFARRPGRSFRARLINDSDLASASEAGFYYNAPLAGMCRVVLVRQVYTGVFLYAVSQVIDGSNLDLPEATCRILYMNAATPCFIKLGNDIEKSAKAAELEQNSSGRGH